MSDTTKLLNACVEYRAMVDKLEAENAALRNEIRQHEEQIEFLIGENTALQKQLEEWGQSTQWFAEWAEKKQDLEQENAELREAKDAFFKHNNILVNLMTEEQKKKALHILIKPKEAQP